MEEIAPQRQAILNEIKKIIVGQDAVIEELLIALFSRGHCLLVGVPGLAKTLLISTLADVLHLHFNRIQFTPDLMPSDITGTDILEEDPETGRRRYRFHAWPHLRQHRAGGRDQPHPAENPGGIAPGDARVSRHCWRPDL